VIVTLEGTTTSAIQRRLIEIREEGGVLALGRVLTLVIHSHLGEEEDAIAAANEASREHPMRVLVVSRSIDEIAATEEPRLDAEIRVGGDAGASEVVLLQCYGELGSHLLGIVQGLLLPDAPVVAWWPSFMPDTPSASQLGQISQRRITDSGKQRDPRAAKALMGVLPDRLRTFDRLTGRQLLHYYGVLRGLRPAVVAERTEDLARAFDLTAALVRPVSDYSAGMTKKIMLAGAMIHAPRLLVLDEPFEAVDPVSSEVILEILTAYVARGGTVILSSHGMELVERVCDGVAVIVAGQVLAHGSVDDVRGDHTLAERFVQLSGGLSDVEGLEWLHTYSD